jgi:hypothetical protein
VLGVDEGSHAAAPLRLADRVQGERRLAARLRPVDLHDPAARIPADAERLIERERPGRDHPLRLRDVAVSERHDAPLPELLLDRREHLLQSLELLCDGHFSSLLRPTSLSEARRGGLISSGVPARDRRIHA